MIYDHAEFAHIISAVDWALNSWGLAIKTSWSALAKTANAVRYLKSDWSVTVKAASDMAALAGTVTNAKFNVFVFAITKSSWALTTTMWTQWDSEAAVVFPEIDPRDKVVLWYVLINPTGTWNFVWGTTALDDATVVPWAVYVNLDWKAYPWAKLD